jgi:hypothetical protein
VAEPFARAARALVFVLLVASTACTSEQAQIQEHRKQLHSLRATGAQVGNAWLAGDVSSTYARAALETASQLLERQRATLAAEPERLADSSFARVFSDLNAGANALGLLIHDIASNDRNALRQHLALVALEDTSR